MIILGLDPGLATTGFGVIRVDKKTPSLLKCGTIRTLPGTHPASRLFQIYTDLLQLIRTTEPDMIAIEKAFSMARYPKAGIILGGVLGIIYLAVFQNGISMSEISPREIKNSLAGYGGADKNQVRSAVKSLLKTSEIRSFHSADALAVALAAYYRRRPGTGR
ncbi:MAG TPA: crossover junction endodeoxyribonuclease RuvC [Thermodesulfovibrionales bacterium]|nr:crossover junction endodeoxyribonuclease RuvC [Thermodesulfovibrionales bacterium]